MEIQKPTVGRIVIYRTDGRNGLFYDLPAVINCTQDTHPGDYPDGKKNPLPVPKSESHVHLTVFTPGGFGSTLTDWDETEEVNDEDWKGAGGFTPGSGTYVEWNVPHYEAQSESERTWRYPEMSRDTINV